MASDMSHNELLEEVINQINNTDQLISLSFSERLMEVYTLRIKLAQEIQNLRLENYTIQNTTNAHELRFKTMTDLIGEGQEFVSDANETTESIMEEVERLQIVEDDLELNYFETWMDLCETLKSIGSEVSELYKTFMSIDCIENGINTMEYRLDELKKEIPKLEREIDEIKIQMYQLNK